MFTCSVGWMFQMQLNEKLNFQQASWALVVKSISWSVRRDNLLRGQKPCSNQVLWALVVKSIPQSHSRACQTLAGMGQHVLSEPTTWVGRNVTSLGLLKPCLLFKPLYYLYWLLKGYTPGLISLDVLIHQNLLGSSDPTIGILGYPAWPTYWLL